MPAIQATRCIRQTALSFFAGKPRSNRDRIQLERCLPANWAMGCIRHNTALMWERCLPAIQATRCIRQTALSFIAGKRAPTDDHRPVGACGRHSDLPANWAMRCIRLNTALMWERCLPAIQAPQCIRKTESSFFAGKPRSNRDGIQLERCLPANWAMGCIRLNTALMWERCLPAIQALRCIRQTASSFIAGKVERHPGRSYGFH